MLLFVDGFFVGCFGGCCLVVYYFVVVVVGIDCGDYEVVLLIWVMIWYVFY